VTPPTARHVVRLLEWQTRHLEGVALRPEDRALADALSGTADARVRLDELRTGLRITARSWVGVVRFSGFELHIVPKLAGGDVGLLRMVDFAKGLDALDRHPAIHTFSAEGASLLDLVALLLAEACEQIARTGLLADYLEVENDLPVVRGRLLLRQQVLRRFGRVDRLECRFDEHTTQTADNQLLLAALAAAGQRVTHPAVALRIRRVQNVFDEACSLEEFDLRLARTTMTYNRLNEHYRDGHQLAWLVLDGLGIDDLYSGGTHRTFAFLLDMNRLFEDFISRWMSLLLKGTPFRPIAQRRDRTILWNADLGRPYTSVIPDLVIERRDVPGRFLPVDAKYKLYDDRSVGTGDIYQTFLYAYAYGKGHAVLPLSIIVYPTATQNLTSQRLHIHPSGEAASAELRVLGVSVPLALAEARSGKAGMFGSAMLAQLRDTLG
jgi:5-methylcytosine-specific restriction enzyme subunit McrC